MWLKFCTLVPWVNPWGCFFHFFKILIFKGVVTSFSPKTRLKTLGQAGDFKNGSISLKFCTLVCWMNPWGFYFYFFKIFIFKGVVTSFSPKTRLKTLRPAVYFKDYPIWLKSCTLVPWVNWNSISFWILQLGLRNDLKDTEVEPVRLARSTVTEKQS